MDKEKVAELAESIDESELLNPIIVRRELLGEGEKGERFRLIAGEHRLAAFKLLGRNFIPAVIRPADETRLAQLEDEIAEIDENVKRNEMMEGEVKLATKKRKRLREEQAALKRAEEAQEARDQELMAKGKVSDATRKKSKRAADASANHGSFNRPVNKKAAGEFNRETAKAHGVSERAVQVRVKEAGEIEKVADWAKVDARDIARSTIQSRNQLAAAIEVIDTYGSGTVVEAGNVHALLRKHVRRAAKGEAIDLVEFKAAVDKELRREELNEKRSKDDVEKHRHLVSMLSKARKAVLDAQEIAQSYKKEKVADRLDQIKRELGQMADGQKVGTKA